MGCLSSELPLCSDYLNSISYFAFAVTQIVYSFHTNLGLLLMSLLYDVPHLLLLFLIFFFYKCGRINYLQRWLNWWVSFFQLVQECQCCNFWRLNEDNIKFVIVYMHRQSSVYVHNKQVEMFHWNSVQQHACWQLFTWLDNDVNLHVMVRMLSLIHIWRCRRVLRCRSRWSPYH